MSSTHCKSKKKSDGLAAHHARHRAEPTNGKSRRHKRRAAAVLPQAQERATVDSNQRQRRGARVHFVYVHPRTRVVVSSLGIVGLLFIKCAFTLTCFFVIVFCRPFWSRACASIRGTWTSSSVYCVYFSRPHTQWVTSRRASCVRRLGNSPTRPSYVLFSAVDMYPCGKKVFFITTDLGQVFKPPRDATDVSVQYRRRGGVLQTVGSP